MRHSLRLALAVSSRSLLALGRLVRSDLECNYCDRKLCNPCKANQEGQCGECYNPNCQVQWCDCDDKDSADAPSSCGDCGTYHCVSHQDFCSYCDQKRQENEEEVGNEEEEDEEVEDEEELD